MRGEFEFDVGALRVVVPNAGVKTIPEDTYFWLRDTDGVEDGVYPLPATVDVWSVGDLYGERVLVAQRGADLYIIGDDERFGLSLFHYVSDGDGGEKYRQAWNLPRRSLQTERRKTSMDSELRSMVQNMGGQRVSSMNLGNDPAETVMHSVNDGVTGEALVRKIAMEARGRGYVAGFVMGSAPAVTMSLQRTHHKDSGDTYDIVAKESKPSRPLGVAMSLPRRCVTRGGQMATPSEIMHGQVDYASGNANETIKQVFPISAAISYIAALGGLLPEYAPTCGGGSRQWPVDVILSNSPEVSFVRVQATEKKNSTSAHDRFNFSLKSTSPRKSLYTEKNVLCMRAVEHIPVKCSTEKEAMEVNECAFRAWEYRRPKTESKDSLTKAINECPSQIWRKDYTIDGSVVKGIGSAFFMAGPIDKNEAGEEIMSRVPTYYPWYATGSKRPAQGTKVTQIVKRVRTKSETTGKERMATVPVKWAENPNHPMLRGYQAFADMLVREGYIRDDELRGMGARTSKTKTKTYALSPDQNQGLLDFIMSDTVKAAVQSVQDQDANRAIIKEAAGK